tara:strand:+ start:244 stop:795 length:552 start_codon:yes stop_codon:yes gene_type:complete
MGKLIRTLDDENKNLIRKAIEEGSLTGEMTLCRAMLCCSIKEIDFSTNDASLEKLKVFLEKNFGDIPSYLIDDVDTIWWDGHLDGSLSISEENELYWHCENHISAVEPNKGYFESILEDLISQQEKNRDHQVFECWDSQKYRLEDEHGGSVQERIEDWGHKLGGYSLTHIIDISCGQLKEFIT